MAMTYRRVVLGKRVTRAEMERFSDTDLQRELMLRRWDRMAKAPTSNQREVDYKDAGTTTMTHIVCGAEQPRKGDV